MVEHKADDEALETELDLARRVRCCFLRKRDRQCARPCLSACLSRTRRPFLSLLLTTRPQPQAFRSLQRAAAGDIGQLTTTLRQAYGAVPGAQRKRLLAPLLDPAVLPPQEPLDPCHPDETSPPTYSPLLIHLLGSSRLNPTPRSEATLAMPPNFPLHGVPNNEELYGRPFLQPGRIASRRWRHFDEITGKLVPPLVVRYIGLDEGAGGKEGLVKRMKACGVDWTRYEGGEQERLLERLERGAGKGQPFRVLPAKRQPIADLDLSVPPPLQPARTPPDDSQSPFSSLSPPDQAIPDEATFNPDLAPVYRSILASVCIVTLDLSATKPPHTWVHIDFSPYATEGPALYHEATEEDRRWLVKTEGGKKKGTKRKD